MVKTEGTSSRGIVDNQNITLRTDRSSTIDLWGCMELVRQNQYQPNQPSSDGAILGCDSLDEMARLSGYGRRTRT